MAITDVCCTRCFNDRRLKSLIGHRGTTGDCSYCGSTDVNVLDPDDLSDFFRPILDGYQIVTAGTHYIPALGEDADGDYLDVLVAEDNLDLFSPLLSGRKRQNLVQALLDRVRGFDPRSGYRDAVDDFWIRAGNEIWAGAEEEYLRSAPVRWQTFEIEIRERWRLVRPSPPAEYDPVTWLTPVLPALTRRVPKSRLLYRAAMGGTFGNFSELHPHSAKRMAGPTPEHCRAGGRANPPGIPVLYMATDVRTAIAEVRPWIGGHVSVATMHATRPLRLVDLSPRRRSSGSALLSPDIQEIVETVGSRMAQPIDPDTSESAYAPTQYVAELIRDKGFDGVIIKSALGKGRNVILFNTADAKVEKVDLYRISGVRYNAVDANPQDDFLPF